MMAVHSRDHCVKEVLTALADGKPKSARDIINFTGIDEKTISHLLSNLWRKHLILRTDKPLFEYSKQFKGKAGFKSNTRMYHLYIINDQTGQGEETQAAKLQMMTLFSLTATDLYNSTLNTLTSAATGAAKARLSLS